MAKFKVEVTRVDEYEIEIDEDIHNELELEEWSKTFSDVDGLKGYAEYLAHSLARNGSEDFHEGFGYVHRKYNGREIHETEGTIYCEGIIVNVLSEDSNIEAEANEI